MDLIDHYEQASADRQIEFYLFILEHPPEGINHIREAIAKINVLREEELLAFFQELEPTIHPDLWEVLTTK